MRKMIRLVMLAIMILVMRNLVHAQTTVPLYNGLIPNSKSVPDEEISVIKDSILLISKVSRPSLIVFLPVKVKATGAAVIICPGGGYWVEAAGLEGADVAKKFNEFGVAAFVLKYRIPDDKTMISKEIAPLQDGQQALIQVRSRAKEWHIDPNRVGIMGFSAGGHIASTVGTHFNRSYVDNPQHINIRPDFMLLIYPVISLTDSIGHPGSREQLLGKNPASDKIKAYSNEFHVTGDTPPTFLVHAKDDGVKVQNSTVFADSLRKYNVPTEVYLYEKGGHGYGMNNKTSSVKWMDLAQAWMRSMKYIR